VLAVNCRVAPPARINGRDSWLEACRIEADVELAGENVLVGLDVDAPLALPRGACLEVLAGRSRAGKDVWFVRCYGIRDSFKDGLFLGCALLDWLCTVGVDADEVWPGVSDATERALWNARIFPAELSPAGFGRWLWMFAPEAASAQELLAFRTADRYSAAEIALLANQEAFHSRRVDIWRSRLPMPCAT
jgi:hypothetical protein